MANSPAGAGRYRHPGGVGHATHGSCGARRMVEAAARPSKLETDREFRRIRPTGEGSALQDGRSVATFAANTTHRIASKTGNNGVRSFQPQGRLVRPCIFCVIRNARAGPATWPTLPGQGIRRLLELHAFDAGCRRGFPRGLVQAGTGAGGSGRRPHQLSDPVRVSGIELLRVIRPGERRRPGLVSLGHDEGGHVSGCQRFDRSSEEKAFPAQVSGLSPRGGDLSELRAGHEGEILLFELPEVVPILSPAHQLATP